MRKNVPLLLTFLGALVPAAEPDFGCSDGMLGGELA